jgi:VWFA-related protein
MARHKLLLTMGLLFTLGWLGLESASAPAAPAGGQNPPQSAVTTTPVILKAETNLVLVDVIATDKKGNYVKDLEKQDFRVFEDDAEMPIASFSRESDIEPNAPGHERYMVLFFDDSTMSPALQIQARQAAGKFVESTASPQRLMAVADFGGTLKIAQNFTADGDILKRAVSAVNYSSLNPNAGAHNAQIATLGTPSFSQAEADMGARTMLLALRDMAKSLGTVPGRKTLILFSSGFPLTPESQSELTATIDALNKANVAVYPVDVRGLAATAGPGTNIFNPTPGRPQTFPPSSDLSIPESAFPHLPGLLAMLEPAPFPDPQKGGTGGGGGGPTGGTGGGAGGGGSRGGSGGGTSGGGSGSGSPGGGSGGGSRGGSGSGGTTNPGRGTGTTGNTGNNLNNPFNNCTNAMGSGGMIGGQNPNCANRQIIPTIPDTVATNQQVLYALAKGTGGFEIFNTNDFLQGLDKVAREMNEYYNIGYTPPNQTHEGNYHKIKVTVERKGITVRYRTGYFDVKSPDLLKDKPEGKVLEERAAGAESGEIPVSLTAPYFYVEPGVARVNLALSIPGSSIDFEKQKGDFHSDVNVLGIAYRANGSVAARFSDTVKLDYQKKELKDFAKSSFDYQNSFNIAPGSYTLKLVLSAGGEKFGKYVTPLVVDPFSGSDLCLGGPALGAGFLPVSQLAAKMDAALLEERTPLVFNGMQLVPSTDYRFPKTAQPVAYVEVFDPILKDPTPPRVGVTYNIFDRKSNQNVFSSGTILINDYAQAGNPLVPVGVKLPVDKLPAGDYRLEIKGLDAVGNTSSVRVADFSVQ